MPSVLELVWSRLKIMSCLHLVVSKQVHSKSGGIIGNEAVIALNVHGIIMSGAGRLHAGTSECPVRNLKRNWEAKV